MRRLLPLAPWRSSRSAAVLAALLALTGRAHAQGGAPDPADPSAEARRLIEEAAKAYEAGDKPRAEQAYEGAFALRRTFDTATNLGIVELELGQFRDAAMHLDFASRNFPPAESQEKKDRLAKLLAEAKSKVASLRVEVDVPRARVTVGGRDEGETPLEAEAFAEPGRIKVQVEKAGYQTESREIDVAAGLSETVTITLRASGEVTSEKPVWPYIIFGVAGAAGLGLGIGGIVVSEGAKSDADEAASVRPDGVCAEAGTCGDIQTLLDDATTFRGVGIAGFALAGAAGIGAIIYAVVPGGSKDPEAARIVPTLGGFLVEGRY